MQIRLSIIALICFPLALWSQTFEIAGGDTINLTDAQSRKQGFWRYFWPDGDLKYEVYYEDGEKEGIEIKYYDQQDCLEYSNNWHNSKLDGPSVTFFPNCSTRCEESYVDGLKSGYERCY